MEACISLASKMGCKKKTDKSKQPSYSKILQLSSTRKVQNEKNLETYAREDIIEYFTWMNRDGRYFSVTFRISAYQL